MTHSLVLSHSFWMLHSQLSQLLVTTDYEEDVRTTAATQANTTGVTSAACCKIALQKCHVCKGWTRCEAQGTIH